MRCACTYMQWRNAVMYMYMTSATRANVGTTFKFPAESEQRHSDVWSTSDLNRKVLMAFTALTAFMKLNFHEHVYIIVR